MVHKLNIQQIHVEYTHVFYLFHDKYSVGKVKKQQPIKIVNMT